MPRHGHDDPRVQKVASQLARLFLRFGSVNAVAEGLSEALGEGGGRIYPNRIHGLLTENASRGVNTATLEALEAAGAQVLEPNGWAIHPDSLRSAMAAALASYDREAAEHRVADQFAVPVGVVRAVTGDPPVAPPDDGEPARGLRIPDWSWQGTAIQDSMSALKKATGRKVGLVIPTGGGKTRVALRVALDWLRQNRGVVLWVTHRHHLERQARRTLHAVIREAGLSAEDAAETFTRIRFTMTHGLADEIVNLAGSLSMVIVDEAHHAAAPSYQPVLALQSIPALFLTATPNRADSLPIGIDEIAYTITYRELFQRGCIIEPVFEPAEDMPDLDWASTTGLRDLADYLLERTETDFSKPLVAVSRQGRAELLYEAVLEQFDARESHPLTADNIGYVHSGANSRALPDAGDFLDEFAAQPAGILIATSQLVGEGFDDPSIDAAVITYPSTSIGHLMQVAGRALRWAPDKDVSHVVQVRQSPLEYYFEQRWLYQDISDALRPELVDLTYSSSAELAAQVRRLLEQHRVTSPVTERVIAQLQTTESGARLTLMLSGLSYFGAPERFDTDASWGAILVTPTERERFVAIFNDASARTDDIKEQHAYLADRIAQDLAAGSLWRSYGSLIPAIEYARREILGTPYHGQANRPYRAGHATTWLKYVTFEFRPTVPEDLDALFADAYNRDELLASFSADPSKWWAALRLELPVFGSEGFLLETAQTEWFLEQYEELTKSLGDAPRDLVIYELAKWRASLDPVPVPLRLIDQMAQFMRPERVGQHLLRLRRGASAVSGRLESRE